MTSFLIATLSLFTGGLVAALYFKVKSQKDQNELIRLQEQLRSKSEASEKTEAEKMALATKLEQLQNQNSQWQSEIASLKTQISEEQKNFADKLKTLQDAETKLLSSFKALSAEALQNNNKSFLELAKQNLEKHQHEAASNLATKEKAIETLVNPLHESLKKFDEKIHNLEKQRIDAYSGLLQQVKFLSETQTQLKAETGNLVNALKAPQVRGRWGEMTLKRVAELAGMVEHCDFFEQESQNTEDGRLRPDMIAKLPHGKQIVIDAKTPLLAYTQAFEAKTEDEKKSHLKNHAKQLQTHLRQLAQKSYWDQFTPTPEFVVMFVPGESFFSAALKENPNLIEEGVEKGVILATPTTLISLLKAVSYGWRQEQLAKNAEEISQLGKDLYDRIGTLASHFEQLGLALNRSTKAYNKAVGTLETRVLTQARRFENLGIKSKEPITRLSTIDSPIRDLQAIELLENNSDDTDGPSLLAKNHD